MISKREDFWLGCATLVMGAILTALIWNIGI